MSLYESANVIDLFKFLIIIHFEMIDIVHGLLIIKNEGEFRVDCFLFHIFDCELLYLLSINIYQFQMIRTIFTAANNIAKLDYRYLGDSGIHPLLSSREGSRDIFRDWLHSTRKLNLRKLQESRLSKQK